jgi:uncharacterized protein YjlB
LRERVNRASSASRTTVSSPIHPRWPLIIYRSAVDLDEHHDAAAVIEDLFEANGWGDTWRDCIYDYVYYHSRI